MSELPKVMVAPTGARRSKADHPNLPMTIPEILDTTLACVAAGADGLHAHVRDSDGQHVLDSGLYRELIAELDARLPGLFVQITTEATGKYSPLEQRQLVRDVMPRAVSISVAENFAEPDGLQQFYFWAHDHKIAVQHILYSPDDLAQLTAAINGGQVPAHNLQLLFVLGRYTHNQESSPSQLTRYLEQSSGLAADWGLCAFGRSETRCLVDGYLRGGKLRVGFENSLWNADGSLATNNAERVSEIAALTRVN